MKRRRSPRRGGFSFTEILFAVMILGIGFIMIAAMFPVAIRQTEAGSQETITAAAGRSSSNYLGTLAAMPLPPLDPTVPGNGIPGMTTNASTQTPSILLPTFEGAALPLASSYVLPPGQGSMVVPGQVWTMCDIRDNWNYTFKPAVSFPPQHNLLLWQSVGKNMIEPGDPRFGWAAMYRRDLIVRGAPGSPGTSIAPAAFAQVIMVGTQCRLTQLYDPATDIPSNPLPTAVPFTPSPLLPTLIGTLNLPGGSPPVGVSIVFSTSSGGPSYINFNRLPTAMVADGAYVVICDDNVPAPPPPTAGRATGGPYINMYLHGAMNGRIFRLGGPPSSPWPMLPGSDLTQSDRALLSSMIVLQPNLQFNVLVVGRAIDRTSVKFAGPAQDVTAYTTFVPIAN